VSGCRSYLAFRGGIEVPKTLGSRSTCLQAQIGGYEGRALRAGDLLEMGDGRALRLQQNVLSPDLVPKYSTRVGLRVMLGPQDDLFTADGIVTFFSAEYTVSPHNDRMGYRLEGPAIAHRTSADIVSDALCPGAIQVPGSGIPIIMGVDCPTAGGYAKIATVIGADLPKLAQTKAGEKIGFIHCSDHEAVAALIAERRCYDMALGGTVGRDAIHRSQL
jgi:antagonist of KipI